jgi:hypothetical protein
LSVHGSFQEKNDAVYADWAVGFYNKMRRSPIPALSGIVLMRDRRSQLASETQTVYDD